MEREGVPQKRPPKCHGRVSLHTLNHTPPSGTNYLSRTHPGLVTQHLRAYDSESVGTPPHPTPGCHSPAPTGSGPLRALVRTPLPPTGVGTRALRSTLVPTPVPASHAHGNPETKRWLERSSVTYQVRGLLRKDRGFRLAEDLRRGTHTFTHLPRRSGVRVPTRSNLDKHPGLRRHGLVGRRACRRRGHPELTSTYL